MLSRVGKLVTSRGRPAPVNLNALRGLRGLRWQLIIVLAGIGFAPALFRGFDPALEILWLLGILGLGGGLLLSLPGGRPRHEGPFAGGLAGLAAGLHAAWTVQRWFDNMPLARPAEGAALVPLLLLFVVGLLAGFGGGALAAWIQEKAPLDDAAQKPRK